MSQFSKSSRTIPPQLKTLTYFLALIGFSNPIWANTFPTTPLHLQDKTTTVSEAGVKPNIMLLIDDSGSMNDRVGGDNTPRKMAVTKGALNAVLDTYQSRVNWSLQTLWNNGGANIGSFTDNHNTVRTQVAKMSSGGGTPTTARYFHVQDIVRDNIQNRCQKSYIVVMSDGDSNLSCNGQRYNLRNFVTGNYVGRSNMPENYGLIKHSLITQEHVNIFGTRETDNSCQNWSGGSGMTIWDREGGLEWFSKTLYENDLKTGTSGEAHGGDWDDPAFPEQNITTFTVGFGSGLSNIGKEYLIKGASPCSGPNCEPYSYVKNNQTIRGSDKHYYNALEEQDLVDAFEQIFKSIDAENTHGKQQVFSATAPAISSNYVDGLAAAASLNTGSWSSELLFFDVDANGQLDTSNPMRASFGNRQLLISNGQSVNVYNDQMGGYSNNWFLIPDAYQSRMHLNATEWRDGLLKWMARDSTTDADIQAGNTNFQLDYRERATADATTTDQRHMGDIIDNSILAAGNMDTSTKRQEFIVTSTNDGMVYVFQSQNNAVNPYDLKFNYVPSAMERHSNNGYDVVGNYYKEAASQGYGQSDDKPHRYLLNGGMVARTTDAGGMGKQVFVASTMGQAGRGAFAINVGGVNRQTGDAIAASNLSTSNWHQDVKLFETVRGASNTLGFTIGTPQIGRVQYIPNSDMTLKNGVDEKIRYGVFVSNGYQYSNDYASGNIQYNDQPALYVYEALGQDVGLTPSTTNVAKGAVLKKIEVTGGSGGLATPTLVDTNFDGVVDYAYAGDFGGGLYRFDLSHANPDSWRATKIFQTANNRPITSAPAIYRNSAQSYTVMVGTGSDIYQEDLVAKNQETLYGIVDDLNLQDAAALVSSTDLLSQTLTNENLTDANGNLIEIRKGSNHAIAAHHKGWQIALDNQNGERITVKPSVMGNSILLTSRVYEQTISGNNNANGDPCLQQTSRASSSAYSWLMQFNTKNGGLIPANNRAVSIDYNLADQARFSLTQGTSTQDYMISGQKLNNLTSITLIDRAIEGYSTTTSGDVGGSGEDAMLTKNPLIPRSDCVGDGSKAFTFNTDGESATYEISGACRSSGYSYKRLSWREIF